MTYESPVVPQMQFTSCYFKPCPVAIPDRLAGYRIHKWKDGNPFHLPAKEKERHSTMQ